MPPTLLFLYRRGGTIPIYAVGSRPRSAFGFSHRPAFRRRVGEDLPAVIVVLLSAVVYGAVPAAGEVSLTPTVPPSATRGELSGLVP